MSTTDSYRETIRITLARRAGEAPDASAVAEATFSIWHQVAARLVPVIGVRGVEVLFSRSMHLTSAAFPWLAIAEVKGGSGALLESVKTRLAGHEADTATEAGYTLLVTFTELLTIYIGESLSERLLGPVWVSTPPVSKRRSYHEQNSNHTSTRHRCTGT